MNDDRWQKTIYMTQLARILLTSRNRDFPHINCNTNNDDAIQHRKQLQNIVDLD